MKLQARVLVVAALAAATNAGCSSRSDDVVDTDVVWDLSNYIDRAEEVGAHPEQVAILEEAQVTGMVPFEVYSEAIDRAMRCLRELGAGVHDGGTIEDQGRLKRSYSVESSAEAADPVEFIPGASVHRCIAEHSIWVEIVYDNQPSSVEAEEEFWEQYRDILVACLRDEGVDVGGDEPILELLDAGASAFRNGETKVDCVAEVVDAADDAHAN